MSVLFLAEAPLPALAGRQILGLPVETFRQRSLDEANVGGAPDWTVRLGADTLWDAAGLTLLRRSIETYEGSAPSLELAVLPDEASRRDYYSLQADGATSGPISIGVTAQRSGAASVGVEQRVVELPSVADFVPFPVSLTEPMQAATPTALLARYETDFDILFANQIAIVSELARRARRSPWAIARGLVPRGGSSFGERVALGFRKIHPTARVHPTAVVEGSIIGAHARVGAHCTVRFSQIGEGVRLHDGAKVELSVVGANSWLMHDLVLYRCHTEDEVFLIHGPYQFSSFHRRSAAFATILMDWLPGDRRIRVATPGGLREYGGPFLGSVLGAGAKTLGGSLLAPGRCVPPETWLGCDPSAIHAPDGLPTVTGRPLPPG